MLDARKFSLLAFCLLMVGKEATSLGAFNLVNVKPASLFANEPPRTDKFIPYGVQISETASMKCGTRNTNELKMVWLKNMRPITPGENPKIVVSEKALNRQRKESYLRIFDSNYEDSGLYYCFLRNATNDAFIDGLYFKLTVYEPVTAIIDRNSLSHLHCQGERKFYENKEWTKDGQPIPDDPRLVQTEIAPEAQGETVRAISILAIFNPQPKDSGLYSCGKERSVVKYPLLIEDPEPLRKHLKKSEKTTFRCEFSTPFKPTYEWRKNGLPVYTDERHLVSQSTIQKSTISPINQKPDVTVTTTVSTLQITNARGADSGNYSCHITNSPDYPYWRDMILTVEDSTPEIPDSTPEIPDPTTAIIFNPGGVAVVQCMMENLSFKPDFVWEKDGVDIDLADYRYFVRSFDVADVLLSSLDRSLPPPENAEAADYESVLTIIHTRPEDAGQYTCQVLRSGRVYRTKTFSLTMTP